MTSPLNSLDLPKAPADTRVVVAMSGGVDSSVVAALLKSEGYDVIGVTLQLYDHGEATHRAGSCCAGQDIHDARQVAARLGVPHYVLDYESKFREKVIDPFAESYATGETPVPCVACNRTFTFWVPLANEHPKVTCYFCGHEFHPLGSPPPAEPHKEKEPVPAVSAQSGAYARTPSGVSPAARTAFTTRSTGAQS